MMNVIKKLYYRCMMGLCKIKANRAFAKQESHLFLHWSEKRIDYHKKLILG